MQRAGTKSQRVGVFVKLKVFVCFELSPRLARRGATATAITMSSGKYTLASSSSSEASQKRKHSNDSPRTLKKKKRERNEGSSSSSNNKYGSMKEWKEKGSSSSSSSSPRKAVSLQQVARQKSKLAGRDDWAETYETAKRKKALIKGLDKIFGLDSFSIPFSYLHMNTVISSFHFLV